MLGFDVGFAIDFFGFVLGQPQGGTHEFLLDIGAGRLDAIPAQLLLKDLMQFIRGGEGEVQHDHIFFEFDGHILDRGHQDQDLFGSFERGDRIP